MVIKTNRLKKKLLNVYLYYLYTSQSYIFFYNQPSFYYISYILVVDLYI